MLCFFNSPGILIQRVRMKRDKPVQLQIASWQKWNSWGFAVVNLHVDTLWILEQNCLLCGRFIFTAESGGNFLPNKPWIFKEIWFLGGSSSLRNHVAIRPFCQTSLFFLQVGDSIISEDCSSEQTCQADGTFAEGPGPECHEFASCQIKDGERGCKCNKGYRGDGVSACDRKDPGALST